MKTSLLGAVSAAIFAVSLFVAAPVPASAANYTVDLSHSFIQFRTKHLGMSWLPGQFNKFEGKMVYDPAKGPSDQSIEITIDTTSIDTNWADRDKHLRSADFFNVDKYPTATFKSTKFDGDAFCFFVGGTSSCCFFFLLLTP